MLPHVIQQKTLIRQFSNGEERLQKKQPIRNQDDSKLLSVFVLLVTGSTSYSYI